MKRTVNRGGSFGGSFKVDLGFFGEGEGDSSAADTNTDSENQNGNQGEQQQEQEKTYTQKELDALVQAEGDKRVNAALSNFKAKELPGLITKATTEAEQLAKMSAEQKADHERKQLEESLTQREQAATARELKIEAHKVLIEKGLPVELLDVLSYSSAEDCNNSIDAVEKAFRQAVESGVAQRLKGNPPPKAATGTQQKAQTIGELMQEANAHPERMKEILAKIETMNKGDKKQ